MAIECGGPAVEAAQRDILGHVRGIPGLELAARVLLDDLEADAAIGVLERQVLLAEALTLFRDGHTALDEMFLPPGQCADGRVIRNRRDLPGTALAGVADRKSTSLNSSHYCASHMPSSA